MSSRRRIQVGILWGLLVLSGGCQLIISSGSDTYLGDLAYRDLASGSVAVVLSNEGHKQLKVFNDSVSYEAEYALYRTTPAPAVDFVSHQVVALELGPMPSTGYSLEVLAVEEHTAAIIVYVVNAIPGEGCAFPALASDSFYRFIAVPRSGTRPILFKESLDYYPCP